MWSVIFCALSAVVSGLAVLSCASSARSAQAASESLQEELALSRSLGASLSGSLKNLKTAHAELELLVEELANRIKMQRVRTISSHADRSARDGGRQPGEPDGRTDPEGWRRWRNEQLYAPKTGAVRQQE